ncbi:MAG TPA: universal stress protein [Acidimicrobiia bacterium]|nr:universal stress protein [Acidimicrobiia bacterium]
MTGIILAAIDNSPSCSSVLAHAALCAAEVDGQVCAVYVNASAAPDLELPSWKGAGVYVVDGNPVERLLRIASHPAVTAVVIGRGGAPGASAPGDVCRALASRLAKPLLIVPPEVSRTPAFTRVLIPLEGTVETTTPIAAFLRALAPGHGRETILLHVFTPENLPPFADHEPHESNAWVQEFLTRFAPPADHRRRMTMRVGRLEDVGRVADEVHADVIAVAWSQDLAEGRARVISALLEHSTRPVLLVPMDYRGGADTNACIVTARSTARGRGDATSDDSYCPAAVL